MEVSRREIEVSGDMASREKEKNLYDIVIIIDEPSEEVLNVTPIQCDILFESSD